MAEGSYDAGVGVVVRRHVNGLEGSNAAAFGGGDPFLQGAHFRAQSGLVAYGGRHPPQQGGHFHARQDVAIDVVNKEEHVLVLLLPEILGHGQAGQPDAGPHARRFVHLPEHQHRAAQHPGVLHFVPQVVALAGAFPHAGEHRHPAMHGADVADQFLDDDRLAHAGAAVGAHFAAFGEGGNQVKNLDARFQDFHIGVLVVKGGRIPVDGPELAGFHRAEVVQRGAGDIKEAPQGFGAHGNGDLIAGVGHRGAARQAVGGAEGKAAGPVVADVLLHFQHQAFAGVVNLQGVKQIGQLVGGKLHVHHRANDLGNLSGHFGLSSGWVHRGVSSIARHSELAPE